MSSSPPLTPIRQYVAPVETTSPNNSYRDEFRRRTSSFSSNHERSPVESKRHRFSNASQVSHDFSYPTDEGGGGAGVGGGGMGNLADELDQLDDDYDYDEEVPESTHRRPEGAEDDSMIDGARDSGIDVSYATKQGSSSHTRNFSKPLNHEDKPPDEEGEDGGEGGEDRFSSDLEDLVNTIARMTAYTTTAEDPLIPRTTALLQDLGNQSSLEAGVQRFTTSTNSMTAYATAQTKNMQVLSQSLYPIFAFTAPLDTALIDETLPLVDALLRDLPQPDPTPSQRLQKLSRETADVMQALSHLTDTLQMGKQITLTAARHLRTTHTMVAELLRERETADLARRELAGSDWGEKVHKRFCDAECKDIVAGFAETCERLQVVGGEPDAAPPPTAVA